MKCPKCETKMEQGYVLGNHQIYYSNKKPKWHFCPKSEDIRLSSLNFDVPNVEAWCCKPCRKIIMEY